MMRKMMVAIIAILAMSSCSKPDVTPLKVNILKIIVLEEKSNGYYQTWISTDFNDETPPTLIKSIEGFDKIYQEGTRYLINVRERIEKGEKYYSWTGEIIELPTT